MLTPESLTKKESSKQELEELQEINSLYSKNLFEAAEDKMISFAKKHRKSSLLPAVENLRGLLLFRQKHSLSAISHFKKSIALNPSQPVFNSYVLYNLASAQFEADLLDEAQDTLEDISLESLDKSNRLKVYYLKATLYQKKLLSSEAVRQILLASRLLPEAGSPENSKAIFKLLDQSLQSIHDVPTLGELVQEFEDSPLSDVLLMKLARLEIAAGNTGSAELHLRSLMTRFPQSALYAQASEMISHPGAQTPEDVTSIGVLLPMKGKFGKFGIKSLQGIQLAFGIFSQSDPDSPNSKIQLIVEDSGDEPEQAIQALGRLVTKHHVLAVIGPMLSKGIDLVSQRAQELGVPLISLSRRAGVPMDYVFQAGLTQQLQAYEIARYAIQNLSLRRFAIIYPNDKFGTEIRQNFWDAVESLGGKIVGAESYTPGETDFRTPVDKLSGVFYTEARQRELELLAKEREANQIRKRTRKTEQFFNLRPIVDFDAVFIPDDPKVAGQILPTFAYRDIDNVKFLGTSAWNSPDFLSRVQNYAESAAFADALASDSSSPLIHSFFEKYRASFNQEPTSMEAMAYDAGNLLRKILTSSDRPLSRSEIRDQLKTVKDFPGVTGTIFFKDGQLFRNLKIIKVKDGRFVEAKN